MSTLYVTGFGEFGAVKSNPTSEILEFLSSGGPLVPDDCVKERIDILHVSTHHIDKYFDEVHLSHNNITIHLGVNSKATNFQLEQFAHNNMTFRIPDVKGFQPENEQIDDSQILDNVECTSFLVHDACATLKEEGFDVGVSDDPGRYCCNYIYYKSLRRQMKQSPEKKRAIFVHVPPFHVIDKETQIRFVTRVIELLCSPSYCESDSIFNFSSIACGFSGVLCGSMK
jgi:pyroglutamyl-peptidase